MKTKVGVIRERMKYMRKRKCLLAHRLRNKEEFLFKGIIEDKQDETSRHEIISVVSLMLDKKERSRYEGSSH
jgi:hypothetical protein